MTPSIQEGFGAVYRGRRQGRVSLWPILRKPWSGQIAVEAVRCLMAMPMALEEALQGT